MTPFVSDFSMIISLLLLRDSISYESGAPADQCDAMMPNHGDPAQTGASPYTITSNASTYRCGDTITVIISAATGNFQGFLCQARTDINDNTTIVGILAAAGIYPMKDICGTGKGLTHSEATAEKSAEFTWTGIQDYGAVKFVCTIVKKEAEFWVKETSPAINYLPGGQCSSTTDTSTTTVSTTTTYTTTATDATTTTDTMTTTVTMTTTDKTTTDTTTTEAYKCDNSSSYLMVSSTLIVLLTIPISSLAHI